MVELKEEVYQAIKLEPLERVPTSFFAGGVWSIYNSGNTFEEIGLNGEKYGDMLIATQEKMQNNIVFTCSGFNNFVPIALGGELKRRSPFLNLAPDLKASIVKTADDIEKLDSSKLDAHKYIASCRIGTKKVIQALGNKVEIGATNWGPFTLAGQMRGVSDLLMDIKLAPELADRVIDKATEIIIDFYKPYAEMGLDMASIAEPTASGDMISKPQLEKLVMPRLTKAIKSIKDLGIPHVLLHICGWTEDRLGKMVETGADIFSLDHRVDISKAKAELRDKMCFAGNVDPVKVLKEGKVEDVETSVRACVDKSWYGKGYIVMPGCDLPDSVPLQNLQAFFKAGREYTPKAA